MDGITCDMCDKALLVDDASRYIVKIQIYAAYDPMELTAADIAQDRSDEMARLLRRVADMDATELEDGVYRALRFDLCPACQRVYLACPLPACGDSLNARVGGQCLSYVPVEVQARRADS